MSAGHDNRFDRRTLVRDGLIAGGLLAAAGLGIDKVAGAGGRTTGGIGSARPATVAGRALSTNPERPNILVIVVDQLRFPVWFGAGAAGAPLPPNLTALREGAVTFARHYSASNDCTPARSTLLTGLYTHQTGCMITGASTLDPGFPTWGSILREHGYHTRWLGKWHLTHHDNRWTAAKGERELERYGFAGGVFPSPDGAPGQGWRVDPQIATRFAEWLNTEGDAEPWCTTVSFVNPHDIAWWYVWTNRVRAERNASRSVARLPPNFETPELLIERAKPRLQRSFQQTTATSFGEVPYRGREAHATWLSFLDLYAKLQHTVDAHIGRVLKTLESRPEVAARTVIVFTSDHGEYGASHGLRGKGASAYEEGIRVPLIVKDPRGLLTREPERLRGQLTSSVDVAPLLLTIATGSEEWRSEPRYAHLAGRLDLAQILTDPDAPGRPFVLHATDETVTEYAIEPYAADAPLHVVALRTKKAKYATYSHWPGETITPLAEGEERELYDYSTRDGRLERRNMAGVSAIETSLRAQHEHAFTEELRAPLPRHLGPRRRTGSRTTSRPQGASPPPPRRSAGTATSARSASSRADAREARRGRRNRPRPLKR